MDYWANLGMLPSGRPALIEGEIEVGITRKTALKNENNKTDREMGSITVTNLRLLWVGEKGAASLSCALALQQIVSAEKSGGLVPGAKSPKIKLTVGPLSQQDTRPTNVCYISFRGGNRDGCYENLQLQLETRDWENLRKQRQEAKDIGSRVSKEAFTSGRAGIGGVRRKMMEGKTETDAALAQAFADLDGLMKNASDMVKIATRLTQKLKSGEETDQDGQFAQMVERLGISSPVTKEMAGKRYHKELAKQLADFLYKALAERGGVMLLTDVYAVFNRARGVALVSPDDLVKASELLEVLQVGMRKRKFESGVVVIQSDEHSDSQTSDKLLRLAKECVCVDEVDCAIKLDIPLVLVKEQLLTAEQMGVLCRDVTPEGTMFYPNLFSEW